jgi:hypothetical protein
MLYEDLKRLQSMEIVMFFEVTVDHKRIGRADILILDDSQCTYKR